MAMVMSRRFNICCPPGLTCGPDTGRPLTHPAFYHWGRSDHAPGGLGAIVLS